MSKNVQLYNNSLCFNQYDLRVIVSGSFNREKFLVAKLQNSFEGGNVPPGLTVLEILPLYSIGRENGIFIKKHLQNYNNVHGLIISQTLAREIRQRWNKYSKGHYVISFVKTDLSSKKIQETKARFYYIVTLLPGPCIMTSANVTGIYFKSVQNSLTGDTIKVGHNMNKLNCQNIIQVDRLKWRTYSLMEPSVKQKFTVQANPKCTVPISNTKLSHITEQRQETPSTSAMSVATASCDLNCNIAEQHKPAVKQKVEPVLPQKKVQKVQPFVSNVRPLPSVGQNANQSVIGTAARIPASSSNSVNNVFDFINGNANTSTNRSIIDENNSGIRNANALVPPRRNVFAVRTPSRPSNMNLTHRRNGSGIVFDYLDMSSDNNATTSTSNANRRDGRGENSLVTRNGNRSAIDIDRFNNNSTTRPSSNTTNRLNNSTSNRLSDNKRSTINTVDASNKKVTPTGRYVNKTRAPTASNPVASNGMQSNTVRVSRCHPSNSKNDNNLYIDDFIRKLRRTRLLNFIRNCRIFYPKRNTHILFKRTNVLQPSTRANVIAQRTPIISVPTLPRAQRKISRGIGNVNKQAQNNGSSRPLITDELDFDLNLY